MIADFTLKNLSKIGGGGVVSFFFVKVRFVKIRSIIRTKKVKLMTCSDEIEKLEFNNIIGWFELVKKMCSGFVYEYLSGFCNF